MSRARKIIKNFRVENEMPDHYKTNLRENTNLKSFSPDETKLNHECSNIIVHALTQKLMLTETKEIKDCYAVLSVTVFCTAWVASCNRKHYTTVKFQPIK